MLREFGVHFLYGTNHFDHLIGAVGNGRLIGIKRLYASTDFRFFLTLCGSWAVSDGIAMGGHANEIEMVAWPGVKILGLALTVDDGWVVSAAGSTIGICPDCGRRSRNGHGWSSRSLQDLPVQGKPVTVKLLLSRWRCANRECARRTFTDRLPMIAAPYARRTRRVGEIVGLLGHCAGGRPGERLMQRLGMPVSDDTILRQLKRDAARAQRNSEIRVIGIDGGRRATEPSWSTWSAARSSTYWTTAASRVPPSGFGVILRSRSSAGTATAYMRRQPVMAHRSVSPDPEPSLGHRRADEPFRTCHRQGHSFGGRNC